MKKAWFILLILTAGTLFSLEKEILDNLRSDDLKQNWLGLQQAFLSGDESYLPDVYPLMESDNEKIATLAIKITAGKGGAEGISHIVKGLDDSRPEVVREAITALIPYHSEDLLAYFMDRRQDPDGLIRIAAEAGLYDLTLEADPGPLLQAVSSPSWERVATALKCISMVRDRDRFLDSLLKLASDPRDEVRARVALSLGSYPYSKVSGTLISMARRETYQNVRINAIDALIQTVPSGDTGILDLLADPKLGKWVAQRIEHYNLQESYENQIRENLKQGSKLRPTVLEALKYFNTQGTIKILEEKMCETPSDETLIARGFEVMTRDPYRDFPGHCLKSMIKNGNSSIISYAIWYAGIAGRTEFKSEAVTLLDHKDAYVLLGAISAVGDLKLMEQKEKIAAFTKHPDPEVRRYAEEALSKLQGSDSP